MTLGRSLACNRGLLVMAAALFLLLAVAYFFSMGLRASRGASISSDEPFYMITTQSLLQDGDLDQGNQYKTHSYRSFFDHPDGLWKQSVSLPDGRLLSPHNPGLPVLLVPGFALGGLAGAQVQLLVIAAAAMTMAFLLCERLTGRRQLSWAATLGLGFAATPFIYATEIFPEFPAALDLLGCLLVATADRQLTWLDGFVVAAGLCALCWLGVKYVPLALLVAGYFLWRGDGRGRAVLLVVGTVSAAGYIWFHLAVYQSLTPYNVNVVYAGLDSAELVAEHVSIRDRVYRLWGLLVDRRFGIGRWAPAFLVVVPGLALLAAGDSRHRLVLGLVGIQVLIATFVAITMMGWWFPGRTLMTVVPLTVVPLVMFIERSGTALRVFVGFLGVYGTLVTAGLVEAAQSGEITVIVDPFDMAFRPFQAAGFLFPQYTSWTLETWLLTATWLMVLGGATAVAAIFWNGKGVSPGAGQDCPALSTKSEAGWDSHYMRQGWG